MGVFVTSYEVMWQRVNSTECPCDDQGTATLTNGSTTYTITDIRQDSVYSVTVTANNMAGGTQSNAITAITKKTDAGKHHVLYMYYQLVQPIIVQLHLLLQAM